MEHEAERAAKRGKHNEALRLRLEAAKVGTAIPEEPRNPCVVSDGTNHKWYSRGYGDWVCWHDSERMEWDWSGLIEDCVPPLTINYIT